MFLKCEPCCNAQAVSSVAFVIYFLRTACATISFLSVTNSHFQSLTLAQEKHMLTYLLIVGLVLG